MLEITLLDVFLPIFIGMGPVKVLLVYMALTKDSSPALQRKVAQKTILPLLLSPSCYYWPEHLL